jgi:hypothetical protein
VSSFLVISDPDAAKHVLGATDNRQRNIYDKGLVREVCDRRPFAPAFADVVPAMAGNILPLLPPWLPPWLLPLVDA